MSGGDLALVLASKVASLPERVTYTVMKQADSGESRFCMMSCTIIGITSASERKTAITRFISG
jgi:hypothetical protein